MNWPARIGLALWRALAALPNRATVVIAYCMGWLLFPFGGRVTMVNLRLAFPGMSEAERRQLGRKHFMRLARSVLEMGILWWQPRQRVMDMVKVVGREHLDKLKGQPVIILTPHFVGLNMGGAKFADEWPGSMAFYSKQKNPILDELLLQGRLRFGTPELFAKQDGLRPVIRKIRDGVPFVFLPDMDFGRTDSVFVPFFGVECATVTTLSRLAQLTKARIIPCVTRQLSAGEGYEMRLYPPWDNFPCGDLEQDARRMNQFIEERVLEMPDQYYWVHKRYGTRPVGEPNFYK